MQSYLTAAKKKKYKAPPLTKEDCSQSVPHVSDLIAGLKNVPTESCAFPFSEGYNKVRGANSTPMVFSRRIARTFFSLANALYTTTCNFFWLWLRLRVF